MPARLTLLVHGATAAQRAGWVPTREDALEPTALRDRAALRLPGRIDRVWRSASRAARDTADGLGLAADMETLLDDLGTGRWTGRALAEIAATEPDAMANWLGGDGTDAPHGGESIRALLTRVEFWMRRIGQEGGHHLAVTQAAVARAAIASALEGGTAAFWRVDLDPLCLVRLDGRNGRWTLRSIVPPDRGSGRRA